ncbi:hypothetical protein HZC33_03470, partial [Candidatus Wolfebacteria bacterium]|nr:hypothetical protein [Candidatus Wolfebacteria bacterium]
AATFDSNLLPGVDNQYEIGYSTNQRWKNISISNLLNLGQLSVDPVGATNGSIYYNTTSNSFKGYASSTWSTISSLWNSSSTSIYYNGGNVGIGMTNPTSKFVIADQDSQMVFSQTSTYTLIGSAGISNYPTGRDIRLAPGDGFSTTMTIATTGNIGIGTTAPETKLDVAGSIRTNAVSATMDNATWTSLGYSFPANMGHIQVICSNNVNNSGMYIVAHDNGGVSAGLGTVYIGGVGNYWSFRNSAGVLEVKGWDSSQGVTISGRCSIHASR